MKPLLTRIFFIMLRLWSYFSISTDYKHQESRV